MGCQSACWSYAPSYPYFGTRRQDTRNSSHSQVTHFQSQGKNTVLSSELMMTITHVIEQLVDCLIQRKQQEDNPNPRSLKNYSTVVSRPTKASGGQGWKHKIARPKHRQQAGSNYNCQSYCCSLSFNYCSLNRERELQRMEKGKRTNQREKHVLTLYMKWNEMKHPVWKFPPVSSFRMWLCLNPEPFSTAMPEYAIWITTTKFHRVWLQGKTTK